MLDICDKIKYILDQFSSSDPKKHCQLLQKGIERLIILAVKEEKASRSNDSNDHDEYHTNTQSTIRSWMSRRQCLIRALAQSSASGLSASDRCTILQKYNKSCWIGPSDKLARGHEPSAHSKINIC